MEEAFALQRFLHEEASMLDAHEWRLWLQAVIDEDIVYQMVVRPELSKGDDDGDCVWVYDDNYAALDLRIRQFETGLQKMLDPFPRTARSITNIEAFRDAEDTYFHLYSYGFLLRFRREYEVEQIFFKRRDLIKRYGETDFKIKRRNVEIPRRVFVGKNLLVMV